MATLGEVFLLIRNGASIKQTDGAKGLPITRIETIANRKIDLTRMGYADITDYTQFADYQLQDGDILMSHINSEKHLGKVARYNAVNGEYIIHGMNLLLLRADKQIVSPDYAEHFFNSEMFLRQLPNITKKSVNQASFNVSALKKLHIPIPSLAEQHTIEQSLNKITTLISLRKQQLAKLDELVKSRFIELFGSVEDNRFGIKTVKIKDACELINGKAFKPEDWSDKGLPIVRIQNLNNEQAPFNYFEGEIKEQYLIDTGELLFSWSGTPGTSFGAFFWNRGKAVLNQHIFRVKPKLKFNLFFLQFALNGRIDFIISKAHGGVGLQHITKKELDEVELLLPSVEQQNQFAAFVEQTDKSKFEIQTSLTKLETLKKALMQQYFG